MPELPEVETIRRDLEKFLLSKKVKAVEVRDAKVVIGSQKKWNEVLISRNLKEIQRKGKLLIFVFTKDIYLFIHLKMTGQLIYQEKNRLIAGGHPFSEKSEEKAIGGSLPNKFTRLIITFSGGKLFFNDIRRFAYAKLIDKSDLKKIKEKFGIEPLSSDFKLKSFQSLFKDRNTSVKALLLNQALIAGLGNIYVDESLYLSAIDPRRRAKDLSENEQKKLFLNISKVLKKAISKRGTTFSNYTDGRGNKGNFSSELKVYGKKGEKCEICGEIIEKIKLAGRGTHFCPKCQK